MWFLLGFIGMVLGGLYGWFYYGPGVSGFVGMIVFGVCGAAFLGWVMKDAAEAVDVSEERVFLISIITAVLAAILSSRGDAPVREVWLSIYLALVGGTGVAIHPKWALGGAVAGFVFGSIDAGYLLWKESLQAFPEAVSLVLRSMIFLGLLAPTSWATYHHVWGKK